MVEFLEGEVDVEGFCVCGEEGGYGGGVSWEDAFFDFDDGHGLSIGAFVASSIRYF